MLSNSNNSNDTAGRDELSRSAKRAATAATRLGATVLGRPIELLSMCARWNSKSRPEQPRASMLTIVGAYESYSPNASGVSFTPIGSHVSQRTRRTASSLRATSFDTCSRPPNVPPLSSGRIRKRRGHRWRRASPWYITTGEREGFAGGNEARPSVSYAEWDEAGMPRIESKPSGVEGHPHEEAYLSEDFGQGG